MSAPLLHANKDNKSLNYTNIHMKIQVGWCADFAFFFRQFFFFWPILSKVSDFAYIFPNSKTQMTVLLEYLSLETALLEYIDLYNHYNDNKLL